MVDSILRSERAVELQDACLEELQFETDEETCAAIQKRLALFIRYQVTHDRAYQRYSVELRKVQETKTEGQIGFVSQETEKVKEERAAAQEIRRENVEKRRQEHHEKHIHLQQARLDHQILLNLKLENEISAPTKRPPGSQTAPMAA